MAAAETQEDLFECSVCLNYMLDRNPRSLSCLHTFCEDCLNQLMNNKKIRCPTCRKTTELKSDNVQELIVNFHLLKIKDIGTKPKSSTKENPKSKKNTLCQICDMKPPVYKCKDCPQLMCESCNNKHSKMFKGHAVFEMCEKHEDGITHLCKKCVRPLCMKCGVLDHDEHQDYFVDYNKGTKELREEVKTLHNKMKEEIKQIDSHIEETNINHEISLGLDKSLSVRQRYYEEKIKEIKKYKDVIKTKCEEYERIQKACIETREQCNVRAASLKALTDDSPGFCDRYSQIRPRPQEVLQEAKKNLQDKYRPPPFVLNEYVKESVASNIKEIKQDRTKLVKEKLLLDIPRSDEINCQKQIDFICDDVVLISYNDPEHVIRLNREGEIVARYYPKIKGKYVNGMSVYDNRIYLVQDKAITVISQRYGEDTVVYKPDVRAINKILVVDKSSIFISDYNSTGKVYKYNTESNHTEVMVKDLKHPYYMSVMNTLQGPRYMVTEYNNHRINIYDKRWNLLNSTGGRQGSGDEEFDCPHATAVTECGLLVADWDNYRISHYSLEGQFLGHVITRQDGLGYEPRGIAYRYPYLWVCGYGNPVKCYQVKYQ